MAQSKFKPTQNELEAIEYAISTPELETEIPSYKSYPSAVPRGISKGILGLGQGAGDPSGLMIDEKGNELLPDEAWKIYEKQQEEQKQNLQTSLDKNLPIGTNLGPRVIERATKATVESVPNMIFGGPFSTPVRAGIGAGAAEIAKDIGVEETGQGFIEMGAQIAPDLGKNLVKRGFTAAANEERALIDFARSKGLTESETALLLNQRGLGKDFLQTVSTKGGWVPGKFKKAKDALGRVWENLRSSPEAQSTLSNEAKESLISNISNQMERLPAEQVKLVQEDWNKLLGSKMQGTDVIDFWQKLNYSISKGEGALGTFKEHLQGALNAISPNLGKDFEITNKLYGNYFKLADRMKPNVAATFIDAGEATGLLFGMITGNYPAIAGSLSLKGARQLAAELVTNPRFMNLGSKMISAIEKNNPQIIKQIQNQMILELGKTNAEAAVKLSEVDMDKLFEALKKSENENE